MECRINADVLRFPTNFGAHEASQIRELRRIETKYFSYYIMASEYYYQKGLACYSCPFRIDSHNIYIANKTASHHSTWLILYKLIHSKALSIICVHLLFVIHR